jgi:hypothetical protein
MSATAAEECPAIDRYWDEFHLNERGAAELLGWDERTWNQGDPTPRNGSMRRWARLTSAERTAVGVLGWTQQSWDADQPEQRPPVTTPVAASPPSPTDGLRAKLEAWLSTVGIGSPGPEGATSERRFDYEELLAFARAQPQPLRVAPAEEIYRAFVEHQLAAPLMDVGVGDRVEVWSASKNRWYEGRVSRVKGDDVLVTGRHSGGVIKKWASRRDPKMLRCPRTRGVAWPPPVGVKGQAPEQLQPPQSPLGQVRGAVLCCQLVAVTGMLPMQRLPADATEERTGPDQQQLLAEQEQQDMPRHEGAADVVMGESRDITSAHLID